MSLSEYFGYTFFETNLIVTGDRDFAISVLKQRDIDESIEHVDVLKFIESQGKGFKQIHFTVYVCLIKYTIKSSTLTDIDLISSFKDIVSRAYTVIRLDSKYPRYLKDRFGTAMGLAGQPALDVLNADLNRWLKYTTQAVI